jgi:hypothetical protein
MTVLLAETGARLVQENGFPLRLEIDPDYILSGDVTAPMAVAGGTGTSERVYALTGGVTAPMAFVSGIGTVEPAPTYELTGGVAAPMATVSGTGTFATSYYYLTGGVTAPMATVTGRGASLLALFAMSGGVTAPMAFASAPGSRTWTDRQTGIAGSWSELVAPPPITWTTDAPDAVVWTETVAA